MPIYFGETVVEIKVQGTTASAAVGDQIAHSGDQIPNSGQPTTWRN